MPDEPDDPNHEQGRRKRHRHDKEDSQATCIQNRGDRGHENNRCGMTILTNKVERFR
jgi:hypothetical protein